MNEPLAISCTFDTFRTLKDGGLNFTFSTHESMAGEAAKLVPLKGERLYVVVFTEAQYEAMQVGADVG